MRAILEKFGSQAYIKYRDLYDRSRNVRYRPILAQKHRKSAKKASAAVNVLGEFKKVIGV